MRIIPRDEGFFELFRQQGDVLVRAAQLLHETIEHFDRRVEYGEKFRELEHEGDDVAHEIIERLNRTFVTPLDREDIHNLAHRVDDIIDMVDSAVGKTLLYRITRPTAEMKDLSRIISAASSEIQQAVQLLGKPKKRKELLDHLIEVNRLENEGDSVARQGMYKIVGGRKNTFDLLRWKEVYESLERAIDRCEDVANTLEGIVIKST
ncbi:MAG TPA: DUF47 family protein [Bacteroidota bacterium]